MKKKVILALSLIFSAVFILFIGQFIFKIFYPFPKEIKYGVTFSPKAAANLKLDWKETYLNILTDLEVKNLRIPTYWDLMEKEQDKFDFDQIDFMLSEALKHKAKVILVLGQRQPRWPECHSPIWAKNLKTKERRERLLQFMSVVVNRYKDNEVVSSWQVENEPFLTGFGEGCDSISSNLLKQEVEQVRSLSNKKIILTDSGELGYWIRPMQLSDIFGTTLYREVYNPLIGYTTYPFPAYFYSLKASLTKNLFARENQKTIIIELQAEPWAGGNDLSLMPPARQVQIFSPKEFDKNISFAKDTGFSEIYLWGVEWWYFMSSQGYPEYLSAARKLFR